MTAPLSGDRFIRTLAHYLEANEARLAAPPLPTPACPLPTSPGSQHAGPDAISAASTTASLNSAATGQDSHLHKDYPDTVISSQNAKAGYKPAPIYGLQFPYMSLLGLSNPNSSSLSDIPYMPPRSTLALDFQHLYFMLVQFEHLGLDIGDPALLGEIPKEGLVETEVSANEGRAQSILSVGSIASTISTMSLSSGWSFWQRQSAAANRPVYEYVQGIYDYFSRVTALRLSTRLSDKSSEDSPLRGGQTILGFEKPLPEDGAIQLSFSVFPRLAYLELRNIHPRLIDGWQALRPRLSCLSVKSANIEDVADIVRLGTTPAKDPSEKTHADHEWPRLRMLSLSGNKLTTMNTSSCRCLHTLTHLDLSHNLLVEVPTALAHLFNLRSLNLSHNRISSVTGINTVLGNIQQLDLRGNRLSLLVGLDRLWSLERLDIRDNVVEDAGEVGRLTALPNVEEIWVEGNPFTQQVGYRVNLFSLFKACDLDIRLDGTGPSFVEQRRVSAATTKDTFQEPAAEIAAAAGYPQSPSGPDGKPVETEPTPVKVTKAKKKRLVRLDRSEDQTTDNENSNNSNDNDNETLDKPANKKTSSKRRHKTKHKTRRNTSPDAGDNDSRVRPLSPSSDAIRHKIESMRHEVGTGWLRVLQEMSMADKEDTT